MPNDPAALLHIDDVSLSFGGLKAVAGFRLELPRQSLYGLIGPNGAGKTTIFNLITGIYQPDCGTVRLDGRELRGLKPFQITAAGMARTFQASRLFGPLSVLDNVLVACHAGSRHTMTQAIARTAAHGACEKAMRERALHLLSIFHLEGRRDEEAKNLSYGDRRRLEIARALATNPKVLLLDEPAAGMNSQEKLDLQVLIRKIRDDFSLTILLIEHDMRLIMDLCERIYVLDHGETIAAGAPKEVQADPKVIEAYLGGGAKHGAA